MQRKGRLKIFFGYCAGVGKTYSMEKRMNAESGACEDKKRIATRAKALNLDAIHDTVHEMAKDEARGYSSQRMEV